MMKKTIIPFIMVMLLLCSCGEKASENSAVAPSSGSGNAAENNVANPDSKEITSLYDEDGLSFDIPEPWRKNFKAVTRNVGNNDNTYPQTDFYYTEGDRDIRLMSIGKFTREQWDAMKNGGEKVDDVLLGESADKKHVYSIFYENHDYITDNTLKETLSKIKTEAEALKNKIRIK